MTDASPPNVPAIFRLDFSGMQWGRLDLPASTTCDRAVVRLQSLALAIRACGAADIADELLDIAGEVRMVQETGQRADPQSQKRLIAMLKDLPPVKRPA